MSDIASDIACVYAISIDTSKWVFFMGGGWWVWDYVYPIKIYNGLLAKFIWPPLGLFAFNLM